MAETKTYISQITLPSGNPYYIKDAEARELIAQLGQDLTGALLFVGITTTALKDGDEIAKIIVNGQEHEAQVGDVVIYDKKEFVYSASNAWVELGDFSDLQAQLGDLAYLNKVSTTYTPTGEIIITPANTTVTSTGNFVPAGTVSEQTFNGTEGNLSVSGTYQVVHDITAEFKGTKGTVTVTGDVVAEGTISKPEFNGTAGEVQVQVEYTPAGSISATVGSEEAALSAEGTYSRVTGVSAGFTGTQATINVAGSCIPEGEISKPTITVSEQTGQSTVWTGTVTDENLRFEAADIAFLTGASASLDAAPQFTGSASSVSASGSYTPAGDVSTEISATATTISVSGTYNKVTGVSASFSGTEATLTSKGTFTPSGSVTTPVFTGTSVSFSGAGEFTPSGTVTPTFTLGDATVTSTGKFTPAGTVTRATFAGTEGLVTVTGTVATAAAATFSGKSATITMEKPA